MKDIITKILKDEVVSSGDDMYNMLVIDAADIPILAANLNTAFEQNLRDELIAYKTYENIFDNKFTTVEDLIDEYLKTREK